MPHGSLNLPGVQVVSYGLTLREAGKFIGDRASSQAFFAIVDELCAALNKVGAKPLGDRLKDGLSKKDLDQVWRNGKALTAGIVHTAIEEFATRLATVILKYRAADAHWAKVSKIVVGGGLRDSRVGEVAIGRTTAILQLEGAAVELVPIKRDPDEAALIGGVRLIAPERLKGCSQMVTADIGGSSIRVGLVAFSSKKPHNLTKAALASHEEWEYADEETDPTRDETVQKLAAMLTRMRKKAGNKLAPIITIACPGRIMANGNICYGAQNLPGRWDAKTFNLPAALSSILKSDAEFILHNDAVVQGLSEAADMRDVQHWAVITIGTGLGNAAYSTTPVAKAYATA